VVESNPEARQVSFAEAKQYADSIDAEFFEVSAKSGYNINQSFELVSDLAGIIVEVSSLE
jgi:hypothetical protein